MSVFVIATLRFTEESVYRSYQSKFVQVFNKFEGELLCADENPVLLEGERTCDKVVVMAFDGEEKAREFLYSPEYQEISVERKAGARTESVLVAGLV